jgi:hypothetical protein
MLGINYILMAPFFGAIGTGNCSEKYNYEIDKFQNKRKGLIKCRISPR